MSKSWFLFVCILLVVIFVGFGILDELFNWTNVQTVIPQPTFERATLPLYTVLLVLLFLSYYDMRRLDERVGLAPEILATAGAWIELYVRSVWALCVDRDCKYPELFPILLILGSASSFAIAFGRPIAMSRILPASVSFEGSPFTSREALFADPEATRLLREYLVKCACEENLDFLRDVQEYETITDERALQRKFVQITNLYFGDRETSVNVSGAKRDRIRKTSEASADQRTFTALADEIFGLLKTQYFGKAAQTPEVAQHLRRITAARDVMHGLTGA
jgi:hypothetical protein